MFVAAYPSAAAVDDFDAFLEPRRDAGSFRWTMPQQWHLTLAFLRDVPDHVQDEFGERLIRAASKRSAMVASIAGGGAFPGAEAARILWAGVQVDRPAELAALAAGCRAAAAKSGAAPSGERFRPHLTVARLGRPLEATSWVRLFDAYRGPSWPLAEIALVASHLRAGPGGRSRHEVVATFALRGDAGDHTGRP